MKGHLAEMSADERVVGSTNFAKLIDSLQDENGDWLERLNRTLDT